jgi:opine dehydrogenase
MGIEKVAVLGAGNAGHAVAADLTLAGLCVNLYELPEFEANLAPIRERGGIEITGVVRQGFARVDCVTTDMARAIQDAEYVLVVTQALAHDRLAQLCAPHLRRGQVVVVFPGSGGSLVFGKALHGKDVITAETVSLPYACRVVEPGHVHVHSGPGVREILAAFPALHTGDVVKDLKELYPTVVPGTNVLEVALYNPNVLLHPIGTLFNIGRIEYSKGEFWMYKEGFTPSIWKIVDALDKEKMALLKALDLKPVPYRDHYQWRCEKPWADFAAVSSKGPSGAASRYITEDVPIGMVLWASLGELLGVATPTARAIIHVCSVIHGTDYWAQGRTLDKVGLDPGMSARQVRQYLDTGDRSLGKGTDTDHHAPSQ